MACIAVQLHPAKLSTVAPDLHSEQKFRICSSTCSPCFTMFYIVLSSFIEISWSIFRFARVRRRFCWAVWSRHWLQLHHPQRLAMQAMQHGRAHGRELRADFEPTSRRLRDFESNSQSRWRWKGDWKVTERWLKGGWKVAEIGDDRDVSPRLPNSNLVWRPRLTNLSRVIFLSRFCG